MDSSRTLSAATDALGTLGEQTGSSEAPDGREQHVVADAHGLNQAVALPVLGHQGESGCQARPDVVAGDELAAHPHLAGRGDGCR